VLKLSKTQNNSISVTSGLSSWASWTHSCPVWEIGSGFVGFWSLIDQDPANTGRTGGFTEITDLWQAK